MNNKITDISPLAKAKSLRQVHLEDNPIAQQTCPTHTCFFGNSDED